MAQFTDLFRTAWRDYTTDGVPSTLPHDPKKDEIRPIGPALDQALDDIREIAEAGLKPVQSMQLATTGNVTLSGEQTIDGTLTSNSFVLVWQQSSGTQNGPYVTAAGAWSRMSAFDTGAELFASRYFVREGTANANITFGVQNTTAPTVGVDNISIAVINDSDISTLLVEVSAGATDEGKIQTLDAEGKHDISSLPKEIDVSTSGPLHAVMGTVGGQKVSVFSVESDSLFTVRNPFIDDLSDKAESATTKLAPLELFVGANGFSLGDGARLWFDVSYAGGLGKIWSRDFQIIRDNAAVTAQYPLLYLDGDSRAFHSTSGQTSGRVTGWGWAYWAQLSSGHRLDFQPSQNHGVGGALTSEMVTRMVWMRSAVPGWLVVIMGINDRLQSRTLAESITEMGIYVEEALGLGFRLIIIDNLTKGDGLANTHSTPLTSPQAEYQQEFRRYLADLADNRNVFYVDPARKFINHTTGVWLDTATYDGLHIPPALARAIGEAVAGVVNTNVPPRIRLVNSNAEIYSANSPRGALNANPMWVGTGGTLGTGCSGSLATSWSAVAGAGLAAVFSKTTDATDLSDVQQVVVTGTPSGTVTTDDDGNLDPTPISVVIETDITDAEAADILFGMSGIEASGTGLRAISLCIETTIAGSRVLMSVDGEAQNAGSSVVNLYFDSAAWSGVSVTPRTDALSGTPSAAKLKIMIVGARTGSTGAAMNVTAKFRATSAHKFIGA